MTKGFGRARARREYYTEHNQPKQLYVRALQPDSLELLCSEQMPEPWDSGELAPRIRCRTKAAELGSIREIFEGIQDFRTGTNWSYTLSGLLTLVFCAALAGMSSGQRDLAEYAQDLSQGQLRALGFRRNRKTRKISAPSETTFFRLLKNILPEKLQEKLLECLDHLLGPASPRLIIIDGKELRGSQGLQLLSAFCGETGRFLGAQVVEEKSNEIPAAPQLITACAQDGAMLLVDALHTQDQLARTSVQECKVDYFMTVKKNQPNLRQTLKTICESHRGSFSPSTGHRTNC
jgi:hypothetical protein